MKLTGDGVSYMCNYVTTREGGYYGRMSPGEGVAHVCMSACHQGKEGGGDESIVE